MEVTEMSWEELNLDKGVWTLPAHRVKNRTEHAVPISSLMRDIISRAPGRKKYLFESPIDTSRPVHSFGDATNKLREASGVKDMKLHDLRHSFVTGLCALNTPTRVIEAVVNHRSGEISGIARVYNHHRFEAEKRKALELWSTYLKRLTSGLPTHDINYETFQLPEPPALMIAAE
jgi:integrase